MTDNNHTPTPGPCPGPTILTLLNAILEETRAVHALLEPLEEAEETNPIAAALEDMATAVRSNTRSVSLLVSQAPARPARPASQPVHGRAS